MVRHEGRDRLRAYLAQRIEDDAQLELHMLLMDPFFAHAQNERYRLASREVHEARIGELAHAISTATDGDCVSAALATTAYPGRYAFFLNSAWKKRIGRLGGGFRERFAQHAHRAWHGRDGFGAFTAAVNDALWHDSLSTAFRFPSKELNGHARAIVHGILLAYLSYAATGSVVGAKQLAPLLSVLSSAIPLGETEEWPGTCLFLVE